MERHTRGTEAPMTTITVEARDLDTDSRRCATVETPATADRKSQRVALIDAVTPLYPEAKLRSFSDGAATFLDSHHLIVASFADVPIASRRRRDPEPDDVQDSLFAA